MDEQPDQAEQWIQRLAEASPNNPRLIELDQLQQGSELDTAQLNRARQLARANRYEESVTAYRELFRGETPPRGLAVEYYQTLAGGSDTQWREARDGLRQFSNKYPENDPLSLALGKVLTYREGTRREGIDQLAQIAQEDGLDAAAARSAWRQALLWLEATPADQTLYQAYAQANPSDTEVIQRFEDSIAQNSRAIGLLRFSLESLAVRRSHFGKHLTLILKTQRLKSV